MKLNKQVTSVQGEQGINYLGTQSTLFLHRCALQFRADLGRSNGLFLNRRITR
jgi:hypothetical protein